MNKVIFFTKESSVNCLVVLFLEKDGEERGFFLNAIISFYILDNYHSNIINCPFI